MKKFRTAAMILTLVFSMMLSSFAYPSDNMQNGGGVTAIEFAQGFIDEIAPEDHFVTGESINIYDQNDTIIGFCIDLIRDQEPSGYVVIKLTDIGPVVEEFAMEAGVPNLYDSISDRDAASEDSAEKKLYGFGPTEYVIPKQENGATVYIDSTGEKFSAEQYDCIVEEYCLEQELSADQIRNETYSADASESILAEESESANVPATAAGIVDGYSVICDYNTFIANKGTNISSRFLTGYLRGTIYGSDSVTTTIKKYACAPLAMTNLASYFKSNGYSNAFYGSMTNTFNQFWTSSDTYVDHVTNGITYGNTQINKQAGALRSYFSSRGYSISVTEFSSVSLSNYQQAINANQPCLFDYGAIFNGQAGGHTVFVAGYIETTGPDYLLVADGWNNYYRYLNFSSNFSWKNGRSVKMNTSPSYK